MLENLADGLKIAMFLGSIMRDPENAVLKIIDDFSESNNSEISELKESICTKIECEDIRIVPCESSITVEFVGIQKPLDIFVVNVVSIVYKLLDKMKMIISPFLHEGVNIDETLKGLSIIHNEVNNTTSIEIPRGETIMSLEVKYEEEEKIASIEIPIKSEKILSKLKDMKN